MSATKSKKTVGMLAGTFLAASLSLGAPAPKLYGSIVGLVSDSTGIAQMGASVVLYSRFDRLLQRVLTTEKGAFGFQVLAPGVYTVRVSLTSFLPALKRNILVQPGMQSLLNVSLASVFSSIELVGMAPGDNPIMSDDWKWVLRSASATRPVLRLLPDTGLGSPPLHETTATALFSDTRGLVQLSAGDQGQTSSLGAEPDLGTAFAVATSFLGKNQVQMSGDAGYSLYSGAPAAAFHTSFRRELAAGTSPQVQLTMRQLFLPPRASVVALSGVQGAAPTLRTLSATMGDETRLTDRLRFEYGFSMDSVTFLDRLNYFSPYGRLSYDRGKNGVIQIGYASGTPPPELFAGEGESGLELQQDLAALAQFPRVSLRSGKPRVQRTGIWETGYRKTAGSRTYGVAAYRDAMSNVAVTMTGTDGMAATPDLLPDVFSNGLIVNAGRLQNLGYMGFGEQDLGAHLQATVAFGSGDALTAGSKISEATGLDELRSAIHPSRRYSVTTQVSGSLPAAGTQFIVSYQWASATSLTAEHMFLTERVREEPGLDVCVRQPIPYFGGLPGHVEATADLRNLLAQGYVPLDLGAHRTYLVQMPRSVRGGLNFIF